MSQINLLLFIEIWIFLCCGRLTRFDFLSPGFCSISVAFFATFLLKFVENLWCIQIDFFEVLLISFWLFLILISEFISRKVRIRKKIPIFVSPYVNNCNSLTEYHISINKKLYFFLIIISCLFLIQFCFSVFSLGKSLGANGLFTIGAVSKAINDGDISLNLFSKIAYQYNTLIAYPFCWLFSKDILLKKKKRCLMDLIPIICCVITQLFCANRHNILREILAVIFCCFIFIREYGYNGKEYKRIIKKALCYLLLFLLLFYSARDIVKVSIHNISFGEYIVYYLSSSIVLLGHYFDSPEMVRPLSNLFGETVFNGFYSTLQRWEIVDSNLVTVTNHLVIGGESGIRTGNTYTFIMRPFHDFGLIGVAFFTLCIYGISCYIYQTLKKRTYSVKQYRQKIYLTILLAYFYYIFPLAISDFYFSIESKLMNIFYLILILLISRKLFAIKTRSIV